jgi:hypothetical protein
MKHQIFISPLVLCTLFIFSCSKKHTPEKTDTPPVVKTAAPKKVKTPLSKTIVVNDSVATKSPDGRLYYDLMGRRYWKNYDDGKYYLFNKSMYNNPAFKPH